MAFEVGGQIYTRPAGVDLSGSQFCFVILNSSQQWVLPGAAAAVCHGVLQNAPASGAAAEVLLVGSGGISKLKADGSVAAGEAVGCLDNTGTGRQAAQNDYIMGYALTGDGGAAGLVSIALSANGRLP